MSLRKYEKMKEELTKKESIEKELESLKKEVEDIIIDANYFEGFDQDTTVFYISKNRLMNLLGIKEGVHNPKTWQKIVPQFEITERGE
jgi:hypothetical protein